MSIAIAIIVTLAVANLVFAALAAYTFGDGFVSALRYGASITAILAVGIGAFLGLAYLWVWAI